MAAITATSITVLAIPVSADAIPFYTTDKKEIIDPIYVTGTLEVIQKKAAATTSVNDSNVFVEVTIHGEYRNGVTPKSASNGSGSYTSFTVADISSGSPATGYGAWSYVYSISTAHYFAGDSTTVNLLFN